MEHPIKCFFLFIFSASLIVAQDSINQTQDVDYNIGFLVEVPFALYNVRNITSNTSKISIENMLAIHLSTRITWDNLALEFRPGIIYDEGEDFYTGIECAFYIRYLFTTSKMYFVGGVNIHNNMGGGGNFRSIESNTIILPTISLGWQLSEILGVIVSYSHPIKTYEVYTQSEWESPEEYEIYKGSLINVFNIGIDWTL